MQKNCSLSTSFNGNITHQNSSNNGDITEGLKIPVNASKLLRAGQ